MSRRFFFLYLFVAVSAVELVSIAADWSVIHMSVKPLIMLSLIGYYLASVKVRSNVFVRALFFSWAGDVLLIFVSRSETFFMAGLVAFLISHVLYILAYRQHKTSDTGHGLLGTQKVRYSLPIILIGTGLLVVLYPTLGALRLPVMLYATVLIIMVMSALFRYGFTTSSGFWMVFCGALLFLISDSLLALNKFWSPLPAAGLLIMSTYASAQFLITEGIIRHKGD